MAVEFYARIRLMKALVIICSFLLTSQSPSLNRGGSSSGIQHTLFGDVTMEDAPAGNRGPMTFLVVLYARPGHVIARQSISNNGRYRFFSVPNGDYYVSVEMEGQEVGRVLVNLGEPRSTDVRHDITLRWSARTASSNSVAPVAVYDRDPSNARLFEKAEEHLKKKDYDKALPLLLQIVKADAKDYIAWAELGTAYAGKQDVTAAESAYVRSLELRPSFIVPLVNLARLRMTQRNYDGAIESLSKAVESSPACAECQYLLGESYLQVKKGSKAVIHLGEALKLDPAGMADAHLRLAALYNAAGMKDKAAAEYEEFLKKRPDYPEKDKLKKYITENKKP